MGVALLYPESEKGGRGNKKKVPETGGFSRQRLGDARAVLAHSPVLAKGGRPTETGVKNTPVSEPTLADEGVDKELARGTRGKIAGPGRGKRRGVENPAVLDDTPTLADQGVDKNLAKEARSGPGGLSLAEPGSWRRGQKRAGKKPGHAGFL